MNATNERICKLLDEIEGLDTYKEEKQEELFGLFFSSHLNTYNYKLNKEEN